ncbi:hypothetical protein GLOTRDRAFT_50522, partial [Gloeophyllum trabeum ATCC 11539]
MISCHDLYRISARLCRVTGNADDPFGGLNVILCGDFAQLPPVNRAPLYSHRVGTQVNRGMGPTDQESALGKALWHQFTTVVILRENMRQKTQTKEDSKLRRALENMRYKACTIQDIDFLRSRIAGKTDNKPKLSQPRFRHISVITARNIHRDKLNQLGSTQFAADTNQQLHHFYSVDKWKSDTTSNKSKNKSRSKSSNTYHSETIDDATQNILWNLPHDATNHVPGKLSICIGMPVLIKKNEATECCITNGAEAKVVSWHFDSSSGKPVLDTLFVELVNPPRTIQLDGLPKNVVPLTKHTSNVQCKMPNDRIVFVSRQQIPVLPNFAMTDYASQGRTRPNNVVDLHNCSNHQSYYTCLSRSASAEGTIIIQGFDPAKIMGGASGYLRQ